MERPLKRRRLRSFPVFSDVPDEIKVQIFGYLDILSQFRLRRVSKRWNTLLRDPALFETVILDLRTSCKFSGPLRRHFHQNCYTMFKLHKAGVWSQVKHLILQGHHRISDNTPHSRDSPYPVSHVWRTLLERIGGHHFFGEPDDDFTLLETLVVRNAVVELDSFKYVGDDVLKCRLIVVNGSVAFNDYGCYGVSLEFDIPDSKIFNLSGETVSGEYMGLELSENDSIPLELAQFVVERIEAITNEELFEVGNQYSELLKGREGAVLREDVTKLFDVTQLFDYHHVKVGIKPSGPNPNHTRWLQSEHFDDRMQDLDISRVWEYALVYYASPRNCYRIMDRTEEELENGNCARTDRYLTARGPI